MASLTAEDAALQPGSAKPQRQGATGDRWDLIPRLEKTTIGTRLPSGAVTVRRSEQSGCLLYGPYLHLPVGRYRLGFRCRPGAARLTAQPVLGVEIIVLSRFQVTWRDFTAAELEHGSGGVMFDVPPELSVDGGNEGRFEFRFFHLGNSDLSLDAIAVERLPDEAAPPDPREWRLLGRLRKGWIGRRCSDGGITVGGLSPAGCIAYGGWPYLRLGRGQYRLTIRAHADTPRWPGQPVLGVEIIGRSRWNRDDPMELLLGAPQTGGSREAWGDFLVEELAAGPVTLDFTVATPMALEAGADAPFDIRLHHFGNSALHIEAVELRWLGEDGEAAAPARWRLLGRMRKRAIGRVEGGGVAVAADEVPGRLLSGIRPALRLGEGHYRLEILGQSAAAAAPDVPVLRAEVFESAPLSRLDTLLPGRRRLKARHDFTAADFAGGMAVAEFDALPPVSVETGDRTYDLALSHLGGADLRLSGVDLRRDPPAGTRRSAGYLAGRKKLVLIGNCQCSVLCQAFNQTDVLSNSYITKYHFVQLMPNLYEYARRDIEDCDVLLIQDIDLWNHFPVRDAVRPNTLTIKFPLVRFASQWPFDGWNGPGDREAYAREAPNFTFPFLDGLLARLRREIPDKEARFQAYRQLDRAGIVNYRRIHTLEERRLLKMDEIYDCRIGEFILENFRTRQVFHTTVRPNWQGFNLLIRMILKAIGAPPAEPLTQSADALLRLPQVPVHPKVAADLGIKWADERTRYQAFGREVTWEEYIRRYIEHYG